MKKATKEKKSLNNKKKNTRINNKSNNKINNRQKNKGIFNYDLEVSNQVTNKKKKNNKHYKTKSRKQLNNNNLYNEDYNDDYLDNTTITINNTEYVEKQSEMKVDKEKIKQLQKRKNKERIAKNKKLNKQLQIAQKKELQNTYGKPNKLKQANLKRTQKRIKTIKTAFLLLVIIISITLFVLSPIFNVNQITVTNNKKITQEEIEGILNISNGTNIFKENNEIIKQKLKENPYINVDKTKIRRILPSTLLINIEEREIEYLLEYGGTLAYLDKYGYILEISNKKIDNKIKLIGYTTVEEDMKPGNRLCDEDIRRINEIIQIIEITKNYEIFNKITSINMKDANDYLLIMENEKKIVHLGNISSMDTKIMYVKAILEKEKDNEGEIFVNVDLNNKNAYFKQKV